MLGHDRLCLRLRKLVIVIGLDLFVLFRSVFVVNYLLDWSVGDFMSQLEICVKFNFNVSHFVFSFKVLELVFVNWKRSY